MPHLALPALSLRAVARAGLEAAHSFKSSAALACTGHDGLRDRVLTGLLHDLGAGQASVKHQGALALASLIAAVDDAGYEAKPLR